MSDPFVTLIDGRVVRITSRECLLEREARRVCNKRTRSDRRSYIDQVRRFRGLQAAEELSAKVLEVWAAEFAEKE